jgi:hypothetical protein
MMKVLVACEYSGTVRDAFLDAGHMAVSCDLLPTESTYPRDAMPQHIPWNGHFQGDIWDLLAIDSDWDLLIAHPPCTHLSVSGAWCFTRQPGEPGYKPEYLRTEALKFVKDLMDLPIPRICIENPLSVISSRIRKADQTVQPYEFGHMEQKRTCFWLKNLPPLKKDPRLNVKEEMMLLPKRERERVLWLSAKDRGKERSMFFSGIAQAMADQWGKE